MEWVDQEWTQSLKMSLAKLWSMYQKENKGRLRESVVNAKEYLNMRDKKRKVENELRFFKSDFAKMVLAKEEAVRQGVWCPSLTLFCVCMIYIGLRVCKDDFMKQSQYIFLARVSGFL